MKKIDYISPKAEVVYNSISWVCAGSYGELGAAGGYFTEDEYAW